MSDSPNLNPNLHRDIFAITDRVRRLDADPTSLSLEEYKTLMGELCSGLQKSIDNGLRRALIFAQNLSNDPEISKAAKEIVQDAASFSEFLQFEAKALRQCGVDDLTAENIVQEIELLRNELRAPNYNIERVEQHLSKFHRDVCKAADLTAGALKSERELADQKKQKLIAYGTGLTLANAAGIAATAGAGMPFLFLSTAAGGVMIAWRGTIKDPGEQRPD